jgi:hypothetical protein
VVDVSAASVLLSGKKSWQVSPQMSGPHPQRQQCAQRIAHQTWREIELVSKALVGVRLLVTHRFPLQEAREGLTAILER